MRNRLFNLFNTTKKFYCKDVVKSKHSLPLSLIGGLFTGLGFDMLLNGQHTVLSPGQTNKSFIYFDTSPGIGFFMFENKALIWLQRFVGTQNEARPVGI